MRSMVDQGSADVSASFKKKKCFIADINTECSYGGFILIFNQFTSMALTFMVISKCSNINELSTEYKYRKYLSLVLKQLELISRKPEAI